MRLRALSRSAISGQDFTALDTVKSTQTLPSVPSNLAGAALGTDQIQWTWTGVTGATGYKLYQATSTFVVAVIQGRDVYDPGLVSNVTKIDTAIKGLKGVKKVHDLYTEPGGAIGSEVMTLARATQESVYGRFGIRLETEPVVV